MNRRRRAYRSGHLAEFRAIAALKMKGYRILARRQRTPVGEIDIIARRGTLVAFVEVKRRGELMDALDAVAARQRQRITRAAEAFLAIRPDLRHLQVRFDVVVVLPWRWPRHIIDAWRP